MSARKAGKRPAPRAVTVTLDGPFEGWQAVLRANPKLAVLADLESESLARVITGLDGLILSHNFPDENDEVATSMGEVDPSDALTPLVEKYFEAISTLPPR